MIAGLSTMAVACGMIAGDAHKMPHEAMHPPLFTVALFLFVGVGFCSCQPAVPALYSLCLGPFVASSVMMGWLGAAGAAGRMIGPVLSTQLLAYCGVSTLFAAAAMVYSFAAVLTLCTRRWFQYRPIEPVSQPQLVRRHSSKLEIELTRHIPTWRTFSARVNPRRMSEDMEEEACLDSHPRLFGSFEPEGFGVDSSGVSLGDGGARII